VSGCSNVAWSVRQGLILAASTFHCTGTSPIHASKPTHTQRGSRTCEQRRGVVEDDLRRLVAVPQLPAAAARPRVGMGHAGACSCAIPQLTGASLALCKLGHGSSCDLSGMPTRSSLQRHKVRSQTAHSQDKIRLTLDTEKTLNIGLATTSTLKPRPNQAPPPPIKPHQTRPDQTRPLTLTPRRR
jgi:hypothetical protein